MTPTQQTSPVRSPEAQRAQLAHVAQKAVNLALQGSENQAEHPDNGAEAYATYDHSINVRCEKGDLQLASVKQSESLGLRVLKEGRQGFASTNQLEEDSLRQLSLDAAGLASCSPSDPQRRLPTSEHTDAAKSAGAPGSSAPRINLWNEQLDEWSVADAVEHTGEFLNQLMRVDERISVDTASLSLSRSSRALVNSHGAKQTESDLSLSFSAMGMAVDGDDVGGFDYDAFLVRDPSQLEDIAKDILQRLGERIVGNLKAGAAESYKGPVLFSPEAFASVFLSPLCGASSALAVQRGRSALSEKLGSQVATSKLSIIDNPFDLELGGAGLFDREGVPAKQHLFIEQGVLKSWFHNAYTAAASTNGRPEGSTGHAAGSSRSLPGLSPTALNVLPGPDGSEADLRAELGSGLYVQRFSGSIDPASGDFSGVAKSARWINADGTERPVRETLIAGNSFELLNSIAALSTRSRVCMGSSRSPWALVDGVSVTGGQ